MNYITTTKYITASWEVKYYKYNLSKEVRHKHYLKYKSIQDFKDFTLIANRRIKTILLITYTDEILFTDEDYEHIRESNIWMEEIANKARERYKNKYIQFNTNK